MLWVSDIRRGATDKRLRVDIEVRFGEGANIGMRLRVTVSG